MSSRKVKEEPIEQGTFDRWFATSSEKVERAKKTIGIKDKPVSSREDNRAIHSQRITEAHGKEIQPVELNDEHLLWMERAWEEAKYPMLPGALIATNKRIVFTPFPTRGDIEDVRSVEWQQIREIAHWTPSEDVKRIFTSEAKIRLVLQEGAKRDYVVTTKDGKEQAKWGKLYKYDSRYQSKVTKNSNKYVSKLLVHDNGILSTVFNWS